MSAMVYCLLVPVRLSGNPSQQRRTTLSRLSSTSIPTLNQTQPAKSSRPILSQAAVVLRPHPVHQNENCCQDLVAVGEHALIGLRECNRHGRSFSRLVEQLSFHCLVESGYFLRDCGP